VSQPNFIIIGAAKAGTTALYWYLAEHPEVFMSAVKETNWFAYGRNDLGELVYGDEKLHRFPVRSEHEYAQLFANAGKAKAIGDSSPMYLECPQTAGRIAKALPDAKLICSLRNPVDRAYSDYQMYLRERGRHLDPQRDLSADAHWLQPDAHWMRVSRYHDALLRFFERFPRKNIQVILFDDLRQDTLGTVQDVYRFLGVDPEHAPDFDTPHNVGGVPDNLFVERLFTQASAVRSAIEPWLPKLATKWLRRVRARNMHKAPALPESLRALMAEHFDDDIARTARLIGRDLNAWRRPRLAETG
jgi:hypothetical protein